MQLAQYYHVKHKQYLKKNKKYQGANFWPVIIINLLLTKDEKVCVLNLAKKKKKKTHKP